MEDTFLASLRSILNNPSTDPDVIGWSANGFYCNSEKFIHSLPMRQLCHSATKFGSFRKQLNLRGVYQLGKGSRDVKNFESRHEPKFRRTSSVNNDNILPSNGTAYHPSNVDMEVKSEGQTSFADGDEYDDEIHQIDDKHDHRNNALQNIPFDHFDNDGSGSHSLRLPDFNDFNDFQHNETYLQRFPETGLIDTMSLATAPYPTDSDAQRNIGILKNDLHTLQNEVEGIKRAVMSNGQVGQAAMSNESSIQQRSKRETGPVGEPHSNTRKAAKLALSTHKEEEEKREEESTDLAQAHVYDLNVTYDGTSSPSAADDLESTSSKGEKEGSEASAPALLVEGDNLTGIMDKLPVDSKRDFIDRLAYHVVKLNSKRKGSKGDISSNGDGETDSDHASSSPDTTATPTVLRVYNKIEDVCPLYETASAEEKAEKCPLQILGELVMDKDTNDPDPKIIALSESSRMANSITHIFSHKPKYALTFLNQLRPKLDDDEAMGDATATMREIVGNIWTPEWALMGEEERHSMCMCAMNQLLIVIPPLCHNLRLIAAGRYHNKFTKEQEAIFPDGVLAFIDDTVSTCRLFEQEAGLQ